MLFEVRTYRLKPGALNEVIKRFGDAYEHRKKYSELAAFFFTEIGPLNEITHIWPYESLAHRTEVRIQAAENPNWPPDISEFQYQMQSEIFVPFPFTPEFKPGKWGPVFEWRSYSMTPGAMGGTIDRWGTAIDKRTELSPVLMAMHTDLGPLNKFVHIWPYESLEHRREVRGKAQAEKIWPPPGGAGSLVTQDNKIVFAAPFSPIQ
jgi:hypothetical protein